MSTINAVMIVATIINSTVTIIKKRITMRIFCMLLIVSLNFNSSMTESEVMASVPMIGELLTLLSEDSLLCSHKSTAIILTAV